MPNHNHFLYVEDDPLSREIMQIMIDEVIGMGQLTIFHDSHDFVNRLKNLDPIPNIIFVDIHVAPLNGYQLLQAIRNQPDFQHTKVVAVTASIMGEEVKELRRNGFDSALSKPLDMDTFPDYLTQIKAGSRIWQIQ